MSPEPIDHGARIDAFARAIRTADSPLPEGVDATRMAVYRTLFHNGIVALLSGNFPVLARLLGDDDWQALVRRFYNSGAAQTPYFPQIAEDMVRWLQDLQDVPGWLPELAHYEWIELALQLHDAVMPAHDPHGDLLERVPVLSPLAWPLAYAWPVHRVAREHPPADDPPAQGTCLLVRRDENGRVRFSELSPLVHALLTRIDAEQGLSGRALLLALADDSGLPASSLLTEGAAMLARLRREGTLLGTHPVAD